MDDFDKSESETDRCLFSLSGDLPAPRSFHTATVVENKIFLFGGVREGSLLNDVDILDVATGLWISPKVLGNPPTPRKGHSAVLLNGERIFIFGGSDVLPDDALWFLEVDTPFVKEQKLLTGSAVVAWSKGKLGTLLQPVVVCGPSGVGKGTLISRLMKDFPNVFGFSVSHTTRLPREKEKDGVHYHFTKRSIMELEVQEGKFIESADVHGNLYGTSIAAVEAVADAGKRCLLDIDIQGAQAVKRTCLNALYIFIAPPSFKELEKRLRERGTETEEQIKRRLKNAEDELEQGKNASLFDHLLVNDDLEECYLQLKKVLGLDTPLNYLMAHCSGQSAVLELHARSGQSASVYDQKVLIIGGTTTEGTSLRSVVLFDMSNLIGGAPRSTNGLRCFSLNSYVDDWDTHNFHDKCSL